MRRKTRDLKRCFIININSFNNCKLSPPSPYFSALEGHPHSRGAAYSPTVCRLWAGHGGKGQFHPGMWDLVGRLDNTEVTMSGHVCPALCQSFWIQPITSSVTKSSASPGLSLPGPGILSPPGHFGEPKPSLDDCLPCVGCVCPRAGWQSLVGGGGGGTEIYVSSAFSSATSKWKKLVKQPRDKATVLRLHKAPLPESQRGRRPGSHQSQ